MRRSPSLFHISLRDFLFIALLALASAVLFLATKEPSLQDLGDIGWDFGPLAESLANRKGYQAVVYSAGVSYKAFAHRMPILPLFYSLFPGHLGFAVFFRTLGLGLIALPAFRLWLAMCGRRIIAVCLAALLACPLVLGQFLVLQTEEAWLVVLIPSAFIVLAALSRSDLVRPSQCYKILLYIGFLAALIYLIKSGMIYVSLLVLGIAIMRTAPLVRSRRLLVAGALAPLLGALVLWNVHVVASGGKLTLGTSWDGWNIRKGNNSHFLRYYPHSTLNALEQPGVPGFVTVSSPSIVQEWAIDRDMRQQAAAWIKANPWGFLRITLLKARSALFDPRPIPHEGGRSSIASLLTIVTWSLVKGGTWLLLLSPILGRVVLPAARPLPAFLMDQQLLFCLFLLVYLAPYALGFYYSRHSVPLIPVVVALAAIRFADFLAWRRSRAVASPPLSSARP